MADYVIFTDSACDISKEILNSWGVKSAPLTFRLSGDDVTYCDGEVDIKAFYYKMRDGLVSKTAAVNPEDFINAFEKELILGRDVIYIGFSSGLSATYNSARIARDILVEKYPERRIIALDSLCASAGLGLLLYMAADMAQSGATIDEVLHFAENNRLKICHLFTVEDLVYLKRGGRISPAVAIVGNMLGIKPVLHVDNEGHLINISKVRGRRLAISTLADSYVRARKNTTSQDTVFISHADCREDAELLADMIKERTGVNVFLITSVGAVIGAHAGPGTLALFFVGEERL